MAHVVRRIRSPGARSLAIPIGALSLGVGSAAELSFIVSGGTWSVQLGMFALILLGVVLITLAWRLGVRIEPQFVVIRRWFGEARIPRGEIAGVEIGGYGGNLPFSILWTYIESSLGQLIVIDRAGGESQFPEIFGFSWQMRRLVGTLRASLDLGAPDSPRDGRGDVF